MGIERTSHGRSTSRANAPAVSPVRSVSAGISDGIRMQSCAASAAMGTPMTPKRRASITAAAT
jgi:hypothetical protein